MKKTLLTLFFNVFICSFGQVPNQLTPADKLFGLSKFWQEVNYNFVYMEKVDRAKFDSLYLSLIPVVMNTANDYQYYREMQKFSAFLEDGHTNVFSPFDEMNTTFGEYRIGLRNIGNKAIVEGVNLSKKDLIPIGSEVIEVNGLSTREYIREFVKPYISCSTPSVLEDLCFKGLLRGLAGEKYEIKIRTPEGKIIPLTLIHGTTEEKETYPPMTKPGLLELQWFDHKIACVRLNSFANPKIDSLFIDILPQLYDCQGLILDLRNNGGGSTLNGRRILEYLTHDSLLFGSRCYTRQNISLFKAYGALLKPADTVSGNKNRGISREEALKYFSAFNDKLYYPLEYSPDTIRLNARRLVVPTVILIGHFTASAAEEFLVYADNQEHMTFIGQNTYGSTGQPYEFTLPGGGRARVCTKKNTFPDGREYVGYGVIPDIIVEPTIDDLINQKDPALSKAIEFLVHKINSNQ